MLRLLETYPTATAVSRSKGGILKIKGISAKKADKLKLLAKQNSRNVNLGKAHLIATTAKEILHKFTLIDTQEKYLINLYKDNEVVELLITIPGVGLKSAVTFALEIDGVNRFDNVKKIASYFGVHPTFKESGDGKWGNHMSKRGRGTIRAALFMCAKTGVRCNDPLKDIYARCRAKGMKYNQAIGAAMHKLLRIIFGVLKSKKPFDAEVDKENQINAKQKQKLNKEKSKIKQKENKKSIHRYQSESLDGPISGRKAIDIKKQMASQIPNLE